MKKLFLFAFVLTTLTCAGQIPTGYYNTATGTGYTLKTQLKNIIDNNTNSSNTASYGDLWTLYTHTSYRDHYYENDNSLLDVYSEKPADTDAYEYTTTGNQCGNYSSEGDCYNREHVIPQMVFGQNNYPMYSDAHFVLPTDGWVNNKRDNFPYGKVNMATYTSSNGSKLGSNLNSGYSAGYTGTVFEPIDEFKGDIARCFFYFATRFETEVSGWTYTMFDGSSNQVFTDTFKQILLTWNALDPVSAYEIAKNNRVYTFQGNRNPFIDHPEYVSAIWGFPLGVSDREGLAEVSVFPNPTNNRQISIYTNNAIEHIALTTLNGQVVLKINKPVFGNHMYVLQNLPQGFYLLKLRGEKDDVVIKKIVVN